MTTGRSRLPRTRIGTGAPRGRLLALAVLLLLCASSAWSQAAVEHVVLFQGQESGRQIVRQTDNGATVIDFSYRNNGRGPDLLEELVLAPDGTLQRFRVTGKSTFGATIEESFERDGGFARWQARSDSGARELDGAAAYVPIDYSPETMAAVLRAVVRHGEAISPGWLQLVERGWEQTAPALEARQVEAEVDLLLELGRRLAHPVPEALVIRNVRIFDSEHAQVGPPADVYIADGRIAAEAIDWYAQRGFRQVKIYNSFPREVLPQVVAYAHERGLRVSGHVPAFMRAEEVVRAGFDELQHINQVMLNFLVGPEDDTRTLQRFYLVSEGAHALELDGPEVASFIALLVERGVAVDPTVAVFEDMYQRQGEPLGTFAPVIDHLPPGVQRAARTTSFEVTADNVATYRASFDAMVGMRSAGGAAVHAIRARARCA